MDAESLYWKLAEELYDDPGVENSTMMGHDCLRINGDFFAMINGAGHLIIKVPAGRVTDLVESGAGEHVANGRRVLREWVAITDPDESSWRAHLAEARDFVGGRTR